MATAETDSLEKYSCTICLEIFEDPVTVPCGNNHVYVYYFLSLLSILQLIDSVMGGVLN